MTPTHLPSALRTNLCHISSFGSTQGSSQGVPTLKAVTDHGKLLDDQVQKAKFSILMKTIKEKDPWRLESIVQCIFLHA